MNDIRYILKAPTSFPSGSRKTYITAGVRGQNQQRLFARLGQPGPTPRSKVKQSLLLVSPSLSPSFSDLLSVELTLFSTTLMHTFWVTQSDARGFLNLSERLNLPSALLALLREIAVLLINRINLWCHLCNPSDGSLCLLYCTSGLGQIPDSSSKTQTL